MKKRTVITTEKREVWVIRPLSGKTEEERRDDADDAEAPKSSLPDRIEEGDESPDKKD